VAISKSEPHAGQVPAPPLPRRLGKYDVLDRLAIGGMAEIFVCCERGMAGLERLVVIKRILPHLAVHHSFVEMFLAEARFVALISHPNVVHILELAQDEHGAPFIAMEYVPGSSVRDVLVAAIEREIPTPVGAAMSMIAQACAGAHAAHELKDPQGKPLGLVHRDISPHNLMVTSEGHTKLLDFGIAKATESAELEDNTRTGALKGKVHYMSPEQCKQQPLDRRSDVFALGIVLWESIAQERLFKRDSDLDSMHAIVTGDLRDMRKVRPDVPAVVVSAIEKALKPNREDRYESADAMRRALLDACVQAKISCGLDDVSTFVKPLLGDAQKRRAADLLQAAQDRTMATPVADEDLREGAREDVTLVDKRRPLVRTVDDRPSQLLQQRDGPAVEVKRKTRTKIPVLPDKPEPTLPRWLAATVGVMVALTATLGAVLWWQSRPKAHTGPAFVMGFPPTADPDLMTSDVEPLRRSLEDALDRPVTLVIAKSYDDLQARLLANEIDLAAVPPYLFVETKQRDARVGLIATKLVEGSSGNDSILYVGEGTGISTLAELRGKRMCFPDTKSTTGYLFPRLALKKAGVNPDRDIISHNSGSHMQAMRDLVGGVCDAAATYSGGYLAADRSGVPVARARQLAVLGRSPHDAMTVRSGMAETERAAVKAALLSFTPENGGKDGRVERISGFAEARNADYDAVREALDASR
jgi:eukaryotic-like serine/threonine-protein kinase